MSNKTALEMLIEKIEGLPTPSDIPAYNSGYINALIHVFHEAKDLLPIERRNIKDAHAEGTRNAIAAMKNEEPLTNANDYFQKTFKDGF